MRLINVLVVLFLVFALNVYSQAPQKTNGRSTKNEVVTTRSGKSLVKRLPEGAEGVELKSNTVRVKPGYKFVKQSDGAVAVARIAGGGGAGNNLSGTWNCSCDEGTGTCSAYTDGSTLTCTADTNCKSCTLSVKTKGVNSKIIAYR
jgi:hypothetical protein